MPNTIRLKRGTTEPTAQSLVTGELAVNTGDASIYTKLDDGTVSLVSGKSSRLEISVRNQTGSTIPAGSAVYITGAASNKPLIALARANAEATSSKTLGLTTTAIASGHNGYVVMAGTLDKISTTSYTAGQALWLSATTAGGLTTTMPTAPNHAVFIGIVVTSASNGKIEVRVANGFELEELHNVSITSVTDGHLLAYESSSGLWKNKSASTLGLATTASLTPQVTTLSSFPFNSTIGYQHTFRIVATSNVYVELAANNQLPHPIGTRATFVQMDTGKMDFTPLYGVTILSNGNKLRSTGQYAVVNAIKTNFDEWTIYGELEASFPAAGTILSSSCVSSSGYDFANNYWTGTWTAQIEYADGDGGSYSGTADNTLGCWYPSGWVLDSSSSDATLSWTHGVDSGDFVYGYNYSSTVANGDGTTTTNSGTTVTATDNQSVHTYEGYDGANGWNTNEVLYFDYDTTSLVASSYPAAGTTISSGCTTIDSTDSSGYTWTGVNAYYSTVADGWGGSATSYQLDNPSCGYLPSGYYTAYSVSSLVVSYNDGFGNWYGWNYGETIYYSQADGMGSILSGDFTNIFYSAGYTFYSYFDDAGQQTLYYHFDGVNSYYVDTNP